MDTNVLGNRSHGVAIISRNGYFLSKPEFISGLPKVERGLAVELEIGHRSVKVASWHAPNAAGEGVKTKMQGYQGIMDWINHTNGPILLGFDGNHWNRSTSLQILTIPESNDRWLIENKFFGHNGQHRLHDALIEYLKQHPDEYTKCLAERPNGPLYVSYVRGSKHRPVEDRFDYVFVSDEFRVTHCSYNYLEARASGSDHGFVVAALQI